MQATIDSLQKALAEKADSAEAETAGLRDALDSSQQVRGGSAGDKERARVTVLRGRGGGHRCVAFRVGLGSDEGVVVYTVCVSRTRRTRSSR